MNRTDHKTFVNLSNNSKSLVVESGPGHECDDGTVVVRPRPTGDGDITPVLETLNGQRWTEGPATRSKGRTGTSVHGDTGVLSPSICLKTHTHALKIPRVEGQMGRWP